MADRPEDLDLISELNDLLQLDHDAVHAYTIAIENLQASEHREVLQTFRGDHERHIEELTLLIQQNGGRPTDRSHLTTGPFKAAVQQLARVGGERGILTAFKANERQARDKYQRHAEREHQPRIADVLRRAADDEARHYAWVEKTLEGIGGPLGGKAADALEAGRARVADAMEAGERAAGRMAERLGRRD
jgi:rubrerythrin